MGKTNGSSNSIINQSIFTGVELGVSSAHHAVSSAANNSPRLGLLLRPACSWQKMVAKKGKHRKTQQILPVFGLCLEVLINEQKATKLRPWGGAGRVLSYVTGAQ